MKQELIHEFTVDERRVVVAANQRYMQVVGVIAELHQLQGAIAINPEITGFVSLAEPETPAPTT